MERLDCFNTGNVLETCRKQSPLARVFYISLVFSNARRVLSQCNTRLRLLYVLNKNCDQINFKNDTTLLSLTDMFRQLPQPSSV